MINVKKFIWKIRYFIVAIFICSAFFIGGTYAWINIEILGTKSNRITAGSLDIVLDESKCENISLDNAYPISDEVGLTQVACTFSVENTGTLNTVYSVFLDDLDLVEGEERMPDESMKYAISKNNGENKVGLLSSVVVDNNKLLVTDKVGVGEKNTYEVKFWIDLDAGIEAMNKVFYTKVRVVADINTQNSTIPVDDYYDYDRGKVSLSDEFEIALNSNSSFTDSEGNVWNAGDPLPNPGITYIDSTGKTREVDEMSEMFKLSKATILDLSLWETTNVRNMNFMFLFSGTTTIDVSNFDTSNVEEMEGMFANNRAKIIDVSNFNTSKVRNMQAMFNNSKVTTLDISNFDISNVIYMASMFNGSIANPIYVSDQTSLNRFVSEGIAKSDRIFIK